MLKEKGIHVGSFNRGYIEKLPLDVYNVPEIFVRNLNSINAAVEKHPNWLKVKPINNTLVEIEVYNESTIKNYETQALIR